MSRKWKLLDKESVGDFLITDDGKTIEMRRIGESWTKALQNTYVAKFKRDPNGGDSIDFEYNEVASSVEATGDLTLFSTIVRRITKPEKIFSRYKLVEVVDESDDEWI